MYILPFNPHYGSNQILTPAAASATATISTSSRQLRLWNAGTNVCYVRVYRAADGAQAATTADLPIPANQVVVITKDAQHDTVAHISAAGTTLHVMDGSGF